MEPRSGPCVRPGTRLRLRFPRFLTGAETVQVADESTSEPEMLPNTIFPSWSGPQIPPNPSKTPKPTLSGKTYATFCQHRSRHIKPWLQSAGRNKLMESMLTIRFTVAQPWRINLSTIPYSPQSDWHVVKKLKTQVQTEPTETHY